MKSSVPHSLPSPEVKTRERERGEREREKKDLSPLFVCCISFRHRPDLPLSLAR